MAKNFHIETADDGIKILTFAPKGKMNILSSSVMAELDDILSSLQSDSACKGLVFNSGKDDQFIVGADVNEIDAISTAEKAEESCRQMEGILRKFSTFDFATVAAVHGQCLGGGLELILCCTYRLASDAEATGFAAPEIKLGLIPGAGGTQRLPRLIGVIAGLDMILTGRKYGARKAAKVGLVDAVVPVGRLTEIACQYALQGKKAVRSRSYKGRIKEIFALEKNMLGRKIIARKAREKVTAETKSFYPAAYKALEAVFEGLEMSLEKGLELEARLFSQLVCTRECKSLIHLFHATTDLKKNKFAPEGKSKYGDTRIEQVGIIGAGFMGSGLATLAVDSGFNVLVSDPDAQAVGRLLHHASTYLLRKVQRRRLKKFQYTQKMAMISPELTIAGFNASQLVIEAVFEDLALKRKILSDFEEQMATDLIFASNTSALPIKEIAKGAKNPERVIGMHFFSPVEKMPLLEVVVTKDTAPWAISRAVEFGQALRKQVIIVQDQPGFYTTRVLSLFLSEAIRVLGEGCPIEDVDKALTDFGFPVGPLTLVDEVGIDIGLHVIDTMSAQQMLEKPDHLDKLVDHGYLGRKGGKGFFQYRNGEKLAPDESIYEVLAIEKKSAADFPHDMIVDRCLLLFINEAVKCLDAKIIASAADGDVGAVFGLGFPPFWGGPFKYIDRIGCKSVLKNLHALQDRHGKRFTPADGLVRMAKNGKKFFSEKK